jgi:putative nucleotidyltransferase with HDIG domain
MTEQEVQLLRAEVIARKDLPTIPAVVAKILQLCAKIDNHSRELVTVIENDQALAAKTLRLANSAFFGQRRRVATIPRAIILLGLSTVRNLTLSVKVWDALGTGVARSRLERLWSHSIACAVAARALTVRLNGGDPDESFTAGLLHDVGRLILAMRFRDLYWKATEIDEVDDLDAIERRTFGVDHAEVATWMLEAWELPPAIVEAVRVHHEEPERLAGPGIVAIADRLVAGSNLSTGEIGPNALAVLERTSAQGLTREVWEKTLAQLREAGALGVFR